MGYNQIDVVPLDLLGFIDGAVETASRYSDQTVTLTSQRALFAYLTAYRTLSVTQLMTMSRGTAVGTLTSHRLGIYTVADNGDLTLVARTASQVSGTYAATFTEYAYALDTTGGYPASYNLIKGVRYAFGEVTVFASTAPAIKAVCSNSSSATTARAPRLASRLDSQSDLPTSAAAGTLSNTSDILYVAALA